jgi:hypothetical protein
MSDEKALAALKPIFAQIDVGKTISYDNCGMISLEFVSGENTGRARLFINAGKTNQSIVICNGMTITISRETALELYEIYRDLCIESMLSEPKLLTA